MLDTPVALLIFNRPEATARVFAKIAEAKPRKLFIVADGPRSDAERHKCLQAQAIVEKIDWNCELLTQFSETNLGCRIRVLSGLKWVFENCEDAIILEDDCLPHSTFFRFCSELLEMYRDNNKIMMIGGSNLQFGNKRGNASYYFSVYPQIWGWATWRRAWQKYDLEMNKWPVLQETKWLEEILRYKKAAKHWREIFEYNYQELLDSWDMQWVFACMAEGGLTILPNDNLISNIGFDENATHTKSDIYGVAGMAATGVEFPLRHPENISRDEIADKFLFDNIFAKERESPTLLRRIGRKIISSLPNQIKSSVDDVRAKRRL